MEKQKIFWVVLSVSVFVVIVLVVGVYLLRQKPQPVASAPGTINPISDQGTQVFEYSQEKPQAQAPTTPGEGQKPGEPQTMHFYIGEGEKGQQPAQTPQTATPTPPAPVVQQPQAQPQPVERPAAPRAVAAVPRKAPHAVKPAPRAKPAQRGPDYWIQTGSYKSSSRADELVALLADKGLTGRVFSYDSNTETYYRVRIGPYANSAEARKFLGIVKQIQGLESSFVSQVGGSRNLN